MTNETDTTRALREALDALAGTVPDEQRADYPAALRTWRRRERRRKLILTAVVLLVFTAATVIGLWVLNQASNKAHPLSGVAVAHVVAEPIADRVEFPPEAESVHSSAHS